jgi:site-specific DNA-methyltransferase (adenine-specific)
MVNSVVTNEDCMALMARYPDKYFDLAVVDPPYGHNALDGSRTKNKYGINRGENWDCYRPDKIYFSELQRVSKNQIIWGGNYFISDLVDTKCFIIWDKKIAEGMNNYAMCEMAWTSFNDRPAKIYRKIASGEHRIHPTQKPIALYDWIFQNYAKPTDKILDTHLGSGSSRIAAHKNKLDFTACELDAEYFEAQERRFETYTSQLQLF